MLASRSVVSVLLRELGGVPPRLKAGPAARPKVSSPAKRPPGEPLPTRQATGRLKVTLAGAAAFFLFALLAGLIGLTP